MLFILSFVARGDEEKTVKNKGKTIGLIKY
jgi:hypothetical protein